jgi:amino acid adenylation domain-containing protein/non-ribosomal peptide synthase protein (TIGR01720 family)
VEILPARNLASAEGETARADTLAEKLDRLSPERRALIAMQLKARRENGEKATITRRQSASPPSLSFAQYRLWLLDRLEPGGSTYNMPGALRLSGPLDVTALERGLREIVRRHEILRTIFIDVDGEPIQHVRQDIDLAISRVDLRELAEGDAEARIRELSLEEARQPFDLARGPLLRLKLLRVAEQEHILLLTFHHIVTDGWSHGVFIRELTHLYEAFSEGRPPSLPELPIQYGDFAVWQRERLRGEVLANQLDYWRRKLGGKLPVLDMPTDRPRHLMQTSSGATLSVELPRALFGSLKELSQREGVTLFMTLLAAFKILLYRYTGQKDIIVGTPIAGRNREQIEGLIGFFVNMLPLRTDLSDEPNFRQLLGRVRATALEAYAHQDLPLEKLVEELKPERQTSHTPLFQVVLSLANVPTSVLNLVGLTLQLLPAASTTAKFDLMLSAEEKGDSLSCSWVYNTDLFDAATVERMSQHFLTLLESIVAGQEQPISAMPLLGEAERRQLLVGFNRNAAHYESEKCVHQLFEAQVERDPDAPALVFGGERLTYLELNCRANQLAHYLKGLGVGPETRVGVMLERSAEMIVAVLGVLKAGGAYVPVDPSYPSERLAYVLADAGVRVLLTRRRLLEELPAGAPYAAVCLDEVELLGQCAENPCVRVSAGNLAYVIYTSGSTGKPKGVMVQHRSVLNLAAALRKDIYAHHPGRLRIALNAPLFFDSSVKQLIQLLYGHTLHVIPEALRRDSTALLSYLKAQELQVLDCTPSLLRLLISEEETAMPEVVLVGGEPIDGRLWEQLKRSDRTTYYNVYGPTECTVDVTVCRVSRDMAQPNIGRAVANTEVYILDEHFRPAPIGLVGEVLVSDPSLARGYLNAPGLTAEKFIPHMYASRPGARLYRTGDLARFLADGSIEFIGRRDSQVKVRGFRIELGEIEAALLAQPGVEEAVVIARSIEEQSAHAADGTEAHDGGGSTLRLVAFVVASGAPIQVEQLRATLRRQLPEYMVPPVVVLERMPLTPNGKADRLALESLAEGGAGGARRSGVESSEGRTAVERQLVAIWRSVLGLEQIGVDDNFFDLGGDSILSIQVTNRAKKLGLDLAPRQVLEHQTIAALASAIGSTKPAVAEQGTVEGPVRLTPIQSWFFEHDFPDPHHWNTAFMVESRHALDAALVERVVALLIAHHDALRLRFTKEGPGYKQISAGLEGQTPFRHLDLSGLPELEQERAVEALADKLQGSLSLSEGPLVRVALFDFGADRPCRLLIIIHHLAVDGVSWRILLEDFQNAYQEMKREGGARLPPKTTSFQHWAQRLWEHAQSEAVREEIPYWTGSLRAQGYRLPADFSGGVNSRGSTRNLSMALDKEETASILYVIPALHSTQITDLLLTAFAATFTRWTGRPHVLFTSANHGREDLFADVDLSRTVGWVNTHVPVLLDLSGAEGLEGALRSVKEQLRRMPNYGIGYGLLRYLRDDRASTEEILAQPESETGFNYLGQLENVTSANSLFQKVAEHHSPIYSLRGNRPYVIDLFAYCLENRLHLRWGYSENIHKCSTVEELAGDFVTTLRSLIKICLSGEEERGFDGQ